MKILGLTYYDGEQTIVLKSDSSLLNNRKPLFVPDSCHEPAVLPCWVLRVSRLGRGVDPKFAVRYYDAVAPGLDFFAADILREAKEHGKPWTEAVAFEGALAVGQWKPIVHSDCPLQPQPQHGSGLQRWELARDGETTQTVEWDSDEMADAFAQAVAQASTMLTIRQGDLIYVAHPYARWALRREDRLTCLHNAEETLFCRIK